MRILISSRFSPDRISAQIPCEEKWRTLARQHLEEQDLEKMLMLVHHAYLEKKVDKSPYRTAQRHRSG